MEENTEENRHMIPPNVGKRASKEECTDVVNMLELMTHPSEKLNTYCNLNIQV